MEDNDNNPGDNNEHININKHNNYMAEIKGPGTFKLKYTCLLYTSPSPRDRTRSRMPSSA